MATTINTLRSFLTSMKAEKKAEFDGVDSSHPSAKQDDGTQPAKEGPRADEHAKDLKEVPGPDNVQTVAEAKPDEQNSQQFNSGLESKAVGTDPTNERDYTEKVDDPGTEHPAKAGKEAFTKARAAAEKNANALLAKLATGKGKVDAAKSAVSPEQKAAAQGYADASAAIDAGPTQSDREKVAAYVIQRGVLAGRLVGQMLTKLAEEDEGGEDKGKKEESSEGGEGGGSPPAEKSPESGESGGGGEATVTDNPQGLLAQMQGGGEGGGGDTSEAEHLMAVLAEMGISPGELIAALQQSAGGAGGGMGGPPPGAGGPPPGPDMGGGAPPMDPTKMASNRRTVLINYARMVKKEAAAGKLRLREPRNQKEVALRAQVKQAILDIIKPHG